MKTNLNEEAKMVAIEAHSGLMYDIYPYHKHLQDVVDILIRFGYDNQMFIQGGWLHDTIEDTTITYNKINKAFGTKVAEIVLAVTDPCDVRSRKEKKARVYPKLQANPDALIVKLADRIANVEHGLRMDTRDKTEMYVKEYPEMKAKLKVEGHADAMWAHLDTLLLKQEATLSN